MATNIPPHNLGEVIDGCMLLLDNPDVTIDELIEKVPAPDFPTGGIIYGVSGVREGYRTGRGRVVMRARTHLEDMDRGNRQAIIVDEIPYQVNKAVLQQRIAELVNEKKIEGISDIRDESDKQGMRVVIELKRGENAEVILNNLYKQTQLQDSFGINMVALVDGQPRLLNLKQMLESFLAHRREVLTRRTVFELRKARERGHLLEGLAVAVANVDEMIALIKASPTPPVAKERLLERTWAAGIAAAMVERAAGDAAALRPDNVEAGVGLQGDGTYRLSDTQASEILQMRLQRLTGLEQEKIVDEYKDVIEKILDLLDILARPERITGIIRDELRDIGEEYGDRAEGSPPLGDRTQHQRTRHRGPDHAAGHGGDALAHRLHQEPAAVRVPGAAPRRARQAGHRHEGRRLDRPAVHRQHARHDPVLLRSRPRLLDQGLGGAAGFARVARPADRQHVPAAWRTRRSPWCCRSRSSTTSHYVFMATSQGTVKKTALSDFSNPRKAGIIAVDLDEGDYLIGAAVTDGEHDVMLFSDAGKAVRFDENDVRSMGRNARGVRGMALEEGQTRDRDAGGRQREAVGADGNRERLWQAHAGIGIHPARPRHQGHDRDPVLGAQRQDGRGDPGGGKRRDHADHQQRRAGAHPRVGDPRDGPRDAGRDADRRRGWRHAVGRAADRRNRSGRRDRCQCGRRTGGGAGSGPPEPERSRSGGGAGSAPEP